MEAFCSFRSKPFLYLTFVLPTKIFSFLTQMDPIVLFLIVIVGACVIFMYQTMIEKQETFAHIWELSNGNIFWYSKLFPQPYYVQCGKSQEEAYLCDVLRKNQSFYQPY